MSSAKSSRSLLESLFLEADMATEITLKPKLKSEKPGEHATGDQQPVDAKMAELKSVLTKLGLTDLKDRLAVDGNQFKLTSTQAQHELDTAVLFDLTKITPLIDKGYVVLDAESDEHGQRTIIILATDSCPDFDIPAADDLDAVEFTKEGGRKDQADTEQLAEEFVRQVIKRKQ